MFPHRWRPRFRLILQIVLLCSLAPWACAQAGALDPAFESAVGSGTVKSLAVQADGKVIAAGAFATGYSDVYEGLFRLNADGTRDLTFSAKVKSGTEMKSLAVQSDGRILVGGLIFDGGFSPRGIVRLLPDGARDSQFAPAFTAIQTPEVQSIAVQPDGRIVIAGHFLTVNGVERRGLARLNADGTLDMSFQTPLDALYSRLTLALQPDGKILIAGSMRDPIRQGAVKIARLLADGSPDATFMSGLRNDTGDVVGMALQSDGRIVLVGLIWMDSVGYPPPRPVVRLLANGARDSTFTADSVDETIAGLVAIEPGGKVLATITPRNGHAVLPAGRRLVRFNTDGSLDPTFVPGAEPDADIHTLRMLPDGRFFAAGAFTTWDGWPAKGIAKIFGGDVPNIPTAPSALAAIRESRTRVALSWTNSAPANGSRIERIEGSAWRELGRTRSGETSFFDTAARPGVAYQYRVTAWNALGSATSPAAAPLLDPPIGAGRLDLDYAPMLTTEGNLSLAVPAAGGKVFVAGSFQYVNGAAHRNLARLNADATPDAQFVAEPPSNQFLRPFSVAPLDDGRVAVCYGSSYYINLYFGDDDGSLLRILSPEGRVESEVIPKTTTFPFYSASVAVTRVAARANVVYYVKTAAGYNTSAASIEAVGLENAVTEKPSFNGQVKGLIPLADGSVLLWGGFTQVSSPGFGVGGARPGVARLKADLRVDEWVPANLPVAPATAYRRVVGAVPAKDGATFLALNEVVTGGTQTRIFRLLDSGAVDPAFSTVALPVFTQNEGDPFAGMSVIDGAVILKFSRKITLEAGATPLTTAFLRYHGTGLLNEAWSRAAASSGAKDIFIVGSDGRALVTQEGMETDSVSSPLRPQLRWLEVDGSPSRPFATATRAGATGAVAVRADGAVVFSRSNFSSPYTAINGMPWAKGAWLRDDGTLDSSFDFAPDGFPLPATRFLFDESDRLLAGGSFTQINGFARNRLARLNADRTTDEDFVPELPPTFSVANFVVRSDGRILVAQGFTLVPTGGMFGLLPDGRAETVPAEIGGSFTGLAAQPDGAVLFNGYYRRGGIEKFGLARLTADNRIDPDYAPPGGGSSFFFALPDGKALVVGAFTTADGRERRSLVRLNADGSIDPAFDSGAGAEGNIYSFAAQPDGKVIVVGNFTSYRGTPRGRIARINADGTLDTTFYSGDADGAIQQVALLADGRIELIGDFSTFDGLPRTGLARLLPGPGPFPPGRPAALRAVRLSATETQLLWENVRNETGYRLERRAVGQTGWVPIVNLGPGATQYTDTRAGAGWEYRLIAIGAVGESQPSAVAAPALPSIPRGLSAAAVSPHAIRLRWKDVRNENGYRIERSADGATGWTEIATTGIDATTYDDTGLTPGTARHYRVSSFNLVETSAPSGSARATTWPEIFPDAQGNWSGLVSRVSTCTYDLSGSAQITVNMLGDFTGTLTVGAKRVVLRGRFTSDGTAAGAIASLPGLLDGFTLTLDSSTGEITGSLLLGSSAQATVRLLHAGVWTTSAPCPYNGAYTVLLAPDANNPAAPAGTGFARVVVNADGTLQFTGMPPDGSTVSLGARISANGEWPLAASLYGGSGSLLGWMKFTADDRIAPSGTPLHWTKPALPGAIVHREALSVALNLSGARYIVRSPVWTPTFAMRIDLGGSDLASLPPTVIAHLRANNAIATPPSRGLNMSLSTATGLFTGTFVLPGGGATRIFRGAILQPDMRGAGFFRGRVKVGSVEFQQDIFTGGVIIHTR